MAWIAGAQAQLKIDDVREQVLVRSPPNYIVPWILYQKGENASTSSISAASDLVAG
jgi:hypothetical protein